ncbi:MAG: hypothetical protein KGI60_04200 [Patescibacteria group bacterium]|nr:hypothetical protein [Patescibacteria group bacterium]
MIFTKHVLFFRSLRVLYQNEPLETLLDTRKYDYITVVSYADLGLEHRGFRVKKKTLANIRLNGTPEEIAGRFARRTQQEIKRTYAMPDLEIRVAEGDTEEAYGLYREFERAQGRKPWKRDTFSNLIHFNAYYKGELIAAVPCYDLSPYLQVRAIFSKRLGAEDKELYKIIGSATRRLIFEICKYGKERGYAFVGLGSVNYTTQQKANVANFKMFFGSEEGEEYTYIYRSPRFLFLENARDFIRGILRIKR